MTATAGCSSWPATSATFVTSCRSGGGTAPCGGRRTPKPRRPGPPIAEMSRPRPSALISTLDRIFNVNRVFVTGAAGFIGSNSRGPPARAGPRRGRLRQSLDRPRASSSRRAPAAALHASSQGDLLDEPRCDAGDGGLRFRLPSRRQRRRPLRHQPSAPRSRAEHDCDLQRARGHARQRRSPRRLLVDGLHLRRADVFPTPETAPFPIQTSLYGASKLAGEGLLARLRARASASQAYIFRFVSILGERYTHGHVFDFYRKLRADPTRIEVLGNGLQRKSYLYVQDCVDAMLHRHRAGARAGQRLQPRDDGVRDRQPVARVHLRGARAVARAAATRAANAAGSATARSSCSTRRGSTRSGWTPRLTIREGILQDAALPPGQPVGARAPAR